MCMCALACSDPFHTGFEDTEDAILVQAATLKPAFPPPDSLKILTWNIRYGAGRIPLFYDGWGNRFDMTKFEVESNLSSLCTKINEIDPDILLLQEVDIESKRTAYVNELQFILDHTQLNYAAYGSIWKADFVPSDGLGRIDMGNAILSKWSLTDCVRIALAIRTDQSSLEKYFWFHRCIIKVTATLPNRSSVDVLNMHAEAWGKDGTKKKHIDLFKEELDQIASAGRVFIAGGDFNELPPGSPRWKTFSDDVPNARFGNDDYTGEETWLNDLYATYTPAIQLTDYHQHPDDYFTFTGDAQGFWCRTLDHLFTNGSFSSSLVLQTRLLPNGQQGTATMPLSDHAPLFSIFMAQ
jgi:endonuclease/exonuclease/phosphatase family metal-dependent hydrolase